MARSRIELDAIFRELLGSTNSYFEPPSTVKMKYPCIVYERSKMDPVHANDSVYLLHKRYTVTVIYYDPDSLLPDMVAMLPMCEHDRHFVNDNLQHDVFTLYF